MVFAIAGILQIERELEIVPERPVEGGETETATTTQELVEKPVQRQSEAPGVVSGSEILALIDTKVEQWGVSRSLVYKIIDNESDFNPSICNQTYGCRAGQGLMQIIPSTAAYCGTKLGRIINPFDPADNLDCGLWLLKNEGIHHWEPYSGPYS